jgi:putative ATPase
MPDDFALPVTGLLRNGFRLASFRSAGDFCAMPDDSQQAGLFKADSPEASPVSTHRPLAVRMRPRNLSEVLGQEHLLASDCLLPRLVKADNFGSLIFYGPPGCGKTSLAEVIAEETKSHFVRLNAVLSNVAELRELLRLARYSPERRTILFIDEIHRFNKSQQDLLLPDVEAGNIRLIGATTHNPGFYVNPPLLSRSHLFRLEPVNADAVAEVLQKAMRETERGLGAHNCKADPEVFKALAEFAGGDLRRALNALETLVLSQANGSAIGLEAVEAFAKERRIRYDRDEDEHYDHASAMIKSIRGSDPDAALYWTFKMLEGGEDPRFLARRLVILASEDIGLANSHALTVAVAAFEACEKVGLPECEYNLAHAVLYLATSPKSNSTTRAIAAVKKALRKDPVQAVPAWLRDAHNKTSRALGNGEGYLYSHDFPEGISGQDYMLEPRKFYQPGDAGAEAAAAKRMEQLRALKARIQSHNITTANDS